jgi:protein-S-isoprenylcysteine O-methyltransferase Ste14
VLLLVVLNYASIGLLTMAFFRPGAQRNARWWATATPHVLCPVLLVAARAAGLSPVTPRRWSTVLDLAAVALSMSSIALMYFAWGTHRVRLAHFHQPGDEPVEVVTWGAYAWIRHPFYTSYFLLYLAAVACFPYWGTIALFVYMVVALNATAAGEERRLSASAFGAEYRAYMARTGRFLPRPGRVPQPVAP